MREAELEHEALHEIHRILSDELGWRAPVSIDERLDADLHLDSIELVALAVGLEDRFLVKLTDADTRGVATIGDLVALVSRRFAAKHGLS
jgi:acyl carrier protein